MKISTQVHVAEPGSAELTEDCTTSLTNHMAKMQEEENAKDANKVDWRTPCFQDVANCNNATISLTGSDAFRCLADNVALGNETTLTEECAIAVEARSDQVALCTLTTLFLYHSCIVKNHSAITLFEHCSHTLLTLF